MMLIVLPFGIGDCEELGPALSVQRGSGVR